MNEDVAALIQLLSDECGWPIDPEMVNRSAWKLNHDELGLNDEIDIGVEVYELRPLVTKQPCGVFFLSIEGESRLSVTLLRRLLRGLVKKKRATAEAASRKLWNLDDLMFVCSLDEPDNVTRYFAHFKETEKGLPKLMIGARWEDAQSSVEIEQEVQKLRKNLHWPDDDNNIEAWRKQWIGGFQVGHREVIKTSTTLSRALARFAADIKQNIPIIHGIEREDGPIHTLHEAFREALIKNLTLLDFADMVAQTITYGLFSARATGIELSGIETLSECIPPTNPFLRDLFSELASLAGDEPTDLDFDDLSLDELVRMLNEVNIDAVMVDFGSQFKGGKEDPVIHFYETFLSEYDHQRRVERGVFYTPKPVVDFIVRSVHDRLIDDFGLPLGLADTSTHIVNGKEWPKVIILDPATGTGTFLEVTIDLIHKTMLNYWISEGNSKSEIPALWNDYVDKHLLPRLYGFELMMAPYSIAHLKLGMKLIQTGYNSNSDNRLNVYLTNTLAEPAPLSSWIPDFISIESRKANSAKQDVQFTIVMGNPPYSGISMNMGDWIVKLLKEKLPISSKTPSYYEIDGKPLSEKKVWLQDDYVKFMRYSQYLIEKTGTGILGMITNNGYLENPTFRGMRRSLMHSFDRIAIVDLHGNSKKKEIASDGSKDENVFDIQQGVAICVCTKKSNNDKTSKFEFADILGTRTRKYSMLKGPLQSKIISIPVSNLYLFVEVDLGMQSEYEIFPSLKDIFIQSTAGIVTARDHFVVGYTQDELVEKIESFSTFVGSSEQLRQQFGLKDNYAWNADVAKREFTIATKSLPLGQLCEPILYRPFDIRTIMYHDSIVFRSRKQIMQGMLGVDNVAISTTRSTEIGGGWTHVFVSDQLTQHHTVSLKEVNHHFQLYLTVNSNENLKSNIPDRIINSLRSHLADVNESNDVDERDIFHYLYAIMHSESYRTRYSEQLIREFPRIPFTSSIELFHKLSGLGANLVAIHTLNSKYSAAFWSVDSEQDPFNSLGCEFVENTNGRVVGAMSNKKAFDNGDVFIDTSSINDCSKFTNVPEDVWNFSIGGYQVCHKWLHDRRKIGDKEGRTLKEGDILHYRRIVRAIECTLELMGHIDEVIEEHGGWPLEGSGEFNIPPDRDPGQTGLGDF